MIPPLTRRLRARDVSVTEPRTTLLALVVFGYVVAYSLAVLSGLPVADRYVLPVLPLAAVLLLRPEDAARLRTPRARAALGVTTLVGLGLVGLLFTVDSASFDGTRWKVAVAATREGWSARQIRGGFEWTNFHERGKKRDRVPACVTVIVNHRGGVHGPKVVAYRFYRPPFNDPVPVVALRNARACTPARRATAP